MPADRIVINASPLILLFKGWFEALLPNLFKEIVVPQSVRNEIAAGHDLAAQEIDKVSWLQHLPVITAPEVLVWNVGDGESEVLSLALAENYTAVVDDRAARNCAQTLSIKTLGTGALLVLAKERGLLDSVGIALDHLRDSGLYLSEPLFELLKRKAGE